ncbi:MAG TPA: alkaline phosphatase D family protein [Vicinamibacterales bacterium]|nr:alkaline phosphatase D family protein [Vicinamibacterales bacterium]
MLIVPPLSRRRFIMATASAAAWPLLAAAQETRSHEAGLFQHGVASGDPLTDRVILWTRVTPARSGYGPIAVRWQVAADERLTQIAASGTADASEDRDFTVKIDAANLRPGRPYYFAFESGGERSPIGRTRTLPERTDRIRLASVSCANYPAGFFNVYRCVANRDDLDAVVHLGDYIYEFANGVYGDGSKTGRPVESAEAITLADYRRRYALYRLDEDLQEVHRRHPFVTVWDDHEVANNAWSRGAQDHTAAKGDWQVRKAAAHRAYREWMPVREGPGEFHLYRSFRFGDLADLVMLDTRSFRDRQPNGDDLAAVADPKRSMLGAQQESWLFDRLRASQRAGAPWRLIGQSVMFATITPPGIRVRAVDQWDGYPAARRRIFDFIAAEKMPDIAILTGDIHSSWANDLPRDPLSGYQGTTGAGSLAVELVTPAVSSPPLFSIDGVRETAPLLRVVSPHIKYLDGENRGYIVADVTRERLTADFYVVPSVTERSPRETLAARYVCEAGSLRLAAG